MTKLVINIVFLLSIVAFVPCAAAVEPPSYEEVLLKLTDLRDQLPDQVQFLLLTTRLDAPDGEETLSTVQEGLVVRDRTNNRWMCKRTVEVLGVKTERPDITEDPETWQRFVTTLKGPLELILFDNGVVRAAEGKTGVFQTVPDGRVCEHPIYPFDFRMLGFGLAGDVEVSNFDQYIAMCQKQLTPRENDWYIAPRWKDETDPGVAIYYFNGIEYEVDVLKDMWFVKQAQVGRRKILGKKVQFNSHTARVTLEQVDDIWVPSYCEMITPTQKSELFMEWKVPEKPIVLQFDEWRLGAELKKEWEQKYLDKIKKEIEADSAK